MGRRIRYRGMESRVAELVLDPGVLADAPVLEVFGWGGVATVGGNAVLPWRAHWLAAHSSGAPGIPSVDELEPDRFAQAVVHLQKGHAATWWGIDQAWRRLRPGGRLLLCGGNELGIKTAVRRLETELGQTAAIIANRAHGRVAEFTRADGSRPDIPEAALHEVKTGDDRFTLRAGAGVFSADGIDPGSQLVLDLLPSLAPPSTVFDPGCGAGVLGLAALRRWQRCRVVLVDADWRAVDCARSNVAALSFEDRAETAWWDATTDEPPLGSCDLVLVNPPIHTGKAVDLEPARAMFRAIEKVLVPGGTAIIVALQTLPFERELREIGKLRQVVVDKGYKVLELRR
jgi:16S rRNA (guanine1207-N2)-methyltransferase